MSRRQSFLPAFRDALLVIGAALLTTVLVSTAIGDESGQWRYAASPEVLVTRPVAAPATRSAPRDPALDNAPVATAPLSVTPIAPPPLERFQGDAAGRVETNWSSPTDGRAFLLESALQVRLPDHERRNNRPPSPSELGAASPHTGTALGATSPPEDTGPRT